MGASADVRGHLWGEPSRAYFSALEHVEYPTPRPGRPLYDRAELLQELHFCQGYHPDALYTVQVHDVAFDGSLSPRGWTATTVTEIRWYIENGRFLQHWYVYDPVEADALDPAMPQGGYDEAPPDYYDRLSLECDLCGETFDAGSIDGTRDWRGTGMDCCGCGNECGSNASAGVGCGADSCGPVAPAAPAPALNHSRSTATAYDSRCEVIRFARHSVAARVAEISATAAAGSGTARRRRAEPRRSSLERRRGSRSSLLQRAQALATGSRVSARRSRGATGERASAPAPAWAAPPAFPDGLRKAAASAMPPVASASAEASAAVSNYMESKVEANIAAFQADTSRLALRPDDWGLMRGLDVVI